MQRSLSWFWPRAERKLYDEPKRLVADGLATATKETTGKRPRTVYGITDAGREELRRWLDEPPAPPTIEFEGLVKMFFAEAGSLDQLNATLDAIAAEATDAARRRWPGCAEAAIESPRFPGAAAHRRAAMRLSLEQEVAVLRWVRVGARAGGAVDRRRQTRATGTRSACSPSWPRTPAPRWVEAGRGTRRLLPDRPHRRRSAPTFAGMAKKAKLAVVMRGVGLAVFCAFFGLAGAVGGIWLMADDLRGQEGPPGQPGMTGPAGEAGVEGRPVRRATCPRSSRRLRC